MRAITAFRRSFASAAQEAGAAAAKRVRTRPKTPVVRTAEEIKAWKEARAAHVAAESAAAKQARAAKKAAAEEVRNKAFELSQIEAKAASTPKVAAAPAKAKFAAPAAKAGPYAWLAHPFQYRAAIVRELSPLFAASAVRSPASEALLGPIDQAAAQAQHARYVSFLRQTVGKVVVLPAAPGCPDSCFIEDTAVTLGDTALVTRPGHDSRVAEVDAVAVALEALGKRVVRMPVDGSARLDGGDVLFTGSEIFVGVGGRTNLGGLEAVAAAFPWAPVTAIHMAELPSARHNRDKRQAASAAKTALIAKLMPTIGRARTLSSSPSSVAVPDSAAAAAAPPLHLKSLVSAVGTDVLLVHDSPLGMEVAEAIAASPRLDRRASPVRFFPVPDMLAANALRVGRRCLIQATDYADDMVGALTADAGAADASQRPRGALRHAAALSMGELAKADGALTCCSLLLH